MQNETPVQPTFLVILDAALVALDIELIIKAEMPGASVRVWRRSDEVDLSKVEGVIAGVFTDESAERLFGSPLGERVRRDGARVAIIGAETSAGIRGVHKVAAPFAVDDILRVLSSEGA